MRSASPSPSPTPASIPSLPTAESERGSRRDPARGTGATPRTVPGTGLSPVALGALILLSTALFLFWDGPLWRAAPDASHVGRFAVSYLAVLPAAALLLFAARRLSWTHLLTASGAAWGVKLLVTSVLYFALARGMALAPVRLSTRPIPAPAKTSLAPATPEYRAATADFARGSLHGTVAVGSAPVAGAAVFLDRPLPGLPAPAPATVTLTISGSRHGAPVYLARAADQLQVTSADATLHTLHLYQGGRAVLNMPVTASGGPRKLPAVEPGVYDVRCDTHASERASLVVVDHPYAALTDAAGQLALAGVPAGPVTLVVVTGESTRRIQAHVEPDRATTLNIDPQAPGGS